MFLDTDEPLGNLFEPGVLLWRGCTIRVLSSTSSPRVTLETHEFDFTKQNQWLCRLRYPGNGIPCPEIVGAKTKRGLVVFLDEAPPEGWTCLLVKGVSRALATSLEDTPPGAVVYAEPCFAFPPVDAYLEARKRLFLRAQECLQVQKVELDAATAMCLYDECFADFGAWQRHISLGLRTMHAPATGHRFEYVFGIGGYVWAPPSMREEQ